MLEIESTGQHVSGRNGNEAIALAGIASEAFARWLHRQCAPVSEGSIILPHDALLQ